MKIRNLNKEIREYAKEYRVFLWEIADALGVSYETFNKRLRHELSDEDKKKIIEIIKSIGLHEGRN